MRRNFFENVNFSIGEEGAVGTEYVRQAAAAGAAAAGAATVAMAAAVAAAASSSLSSKVEEVV